MKVSYNWLQTYFEKDLPKPEKLAELLSAHVFEVESVEKVSDDTVFDIKVMPDRAHYALCHKGIAKEISILTSLPLKTINLKLSTINPDLKIPDIKIGEVKLCSRYIARNIENISVSKSPDWLVKRLEAVGARAINLIVDVTNFVMFDVGQPLHAFDADKVEGATVIRRANEGEKVILLDGKEIFLGADDLIVADDKGPLDIAGIKGGKRAEISEGTKNILLIASNLDSVYIRRTATKYNTRTEASRRYENRIVPEIADEAIDLATKLLLESSVGAKAGATNDVFLRKTLSASITTSVKEIGEMIGIDLSERDFEEILSSIGISFTKNEDSSYFLYSPVGRLDLNIPADIADEVARIKGYENLPSQIPAELSKHTPLDKDFYFGELAKNILIELGFSEALLYTLVSQGFLKISYPLASDKSALRESIAPKLIESLNLNTINAYLLGLEIIKIFEIGKVFTKEGEKTVLCIGLSIVKKKKGQTAKMELEAVLADFEEEFGVAGKGKIETGDYGAIIEMDFDEMVGKLSKQKDIKHLNFKSLPKDKTYKSFSPYPFISRDIAFFTPAGTLDKDAHAVIAESAYKSANKLLVKGPDMFDKFEKPARPDDSGHSGGDGKISFAFRMIFQSFERTLSDDEVNKIMEGVYEAVKKEGWQPR